MPDQETQTEVVERRMVTEVKKDARVKDMGGKLVWWCPFCGRSSEMDKVRCEGKRETGEACEATIGLDSDTGAHHAIGRSEVVETLDGDPSAELQASLNRAASELAEREKSLDLRSSEIDKAGNALSIAEREFGERLTTLKEREADLKKQSKEQDERHIALNNRASLESRRAAELDKREAGAKAGAKASRKASRQVPQKPTEPGPGKPA